MSADAKVIAKIQKLLALAGNNSNEHEAAAAAARAQELMLEHDLAMDQVEAHVDKRTAGIVREHHTLRERGKPGNWKIGLYTTVAATSDCWAWVYSNGESATMIGRRLDVEVAEYLFAYLVSQLERMQQEFGKTRWDEMREYAKREGISLHDAERDYSAMGTHPLRAKDSWIRGAVQSVTYSLEQAKRERDRSSEKANAITISKEADLRDWWAQRQGYADYAEYVAKVKEKKTLDTRTAAQKRKDAIRAEKAAEREYRKQQTRARREAERLDYGAYSTGLEQGREIQIRPGVRQGAPAATPAGALGE